MTERTCFRPAYGTGASVSPAASSAAVSLTAAQRNCRTVRVRNTGTTNIGFFRLGNSESGTVTIAATSADMPVSPGETVYVEKDIDHDRLAHISASGTTFQYIFGEGGMQ